MQMRSILAVASFGIAAGSQLSLLARTSSEQFGESSGLSADQVDDQLGIGASLTGTPTCDSDLSGPLCYANAGRQQVLLPSAVPNGLVGHWDFDSDVPVDSSGSGQHGVTELVHGPAPAGSGHSAEFTRNFMMVPNSKLLKLEDFTYSFWIYLLDDDTKSKNAAWCPLIRKGINMQKTEQYAASPALLFNRKTGKLRAEVTTDYKGTQDGEYVNSNARLLPHRWVHMALVHHSKKQSMLLYVNGILDSVMKTKGKMVQNEYPLYVGGDPFTLQQCSFTIYMDELRVYSHAVPPHQLQAEAAPALGGTDPGYVHLGCMGCSLADAAKSCPKDRHVCTSIELHTGGYQVARSLGWLTKGQQVWTHAAIAKGAAGAEGKAASGLGLCCEGAP